MCYLTPIILVIEPLFVAKLERLEGGIHLLVNEPLKRWHILCYIISNNLKSECLKEHSENALINPYC